MAAVFVGGLIALGSVHAQVPTGSIAGRIVDPTGEAIPGAQLVLTDTATSTPRTAMTSTVGSYEFLELVW